jgi:hypothetical protein
MDIDEGSDRLFTFEVAKTNEQDEDVAVRPGFTVRMPNIFSRGEWRIKCILALDEHPYPLRRAASCGMHAGRVRAAAHFGSRRDRAGDFDEAFRPQSVQRTYLARRNLQSNPATVPHVFSCYFGLRSSLKYLLVLAALFGWALR